MCFIVIKIQKGFFSWEFYPDQNLHLEDESYPIGLNTDEKTENGFMEIKKKKRSRFLVLSVLYPNLVWISFAFRITGASMLMAWRFILLPYMQWTGKKWTDPLGRSKLIQKSTFWIIQLWGSYNCDWWCPRQHILPWFEWSSEHQQLSVFQVWHSLPVIETIWKKK